MDKLIPFVSLRIETKRKSSKSWYYGKETDLARTVYENGQDYAGE